MSISDISKAASTDNKKSVPTKSSAPMFGGKGWDGVKIVQNMTNGSCPMIDSGNDVFALSGTSRSDLVAFDLQCEVNLKSLTRPRPTIVLKNPQQKVNPWALDSVSVRSNRRVKITVTDCMVNGLSIAGSVYQDAPHVGRDEEREALELSCGQLPPLPDGEHHQLQVHNQFGKLKFQHTPISQSVWIELHYLFVGEDGTSGGLCDEKREGDWINATIRVYGVPVEGRKQSFTYTSYDTLYFPQRLSLSNQKDCRPDFFSTTHRIFPIFKSSCLLLKIKNDYVALASAFRKEPSNYSIEFHGTSWGNEITIKTMTVSDMMKDARVFEESGGVLPLISDGSELWLVMPLLSEEQMRSSEGTSGEGTSDEREGLKWWNVTDLRDINSLMFCGRIDETSLIFTRNDQRTMGGFTPLNVECYWWNYNTFKTVHNSGAWTSVFDKEATADEHSRSEGVGVLYV